MLKGVIVFLALYFFLFAEYGASGNINIERIYVPFVENKGQINKDVLFYAKNFGGVLFVTKKGEIVYSLSAGNNLAYSFKETFPKGNIYKISGEGLVTSRINYLVGERKNWRTNLKAYRYVNIQEVAKGIKLKLKAYGNNIEKIFVVKPGADPNNIKVEVDGVDKLEVSKEGNLILLTELGTVKFSKPIAYQEINGKKKFIKVAYHVEGNTYGFKILEEYDKNKDLIIDPVIAATFIGGSTDDIIYAIKRATFTDPVNNTQIDAVYVVGVTDSPNFPTVSGTYEANKKDIFVSIFDLTLQNLIGSAYIGGSEIDIPADFDIDSSGNLYIVGGTNSDNLSGNINSISGNFDAFISKVSGDLSNVISRYLGGAGYDYANSVKVISSTNTVYVAGATSSEQIVLNATTTVSSQGASSQDNIYDGFIVKYDTTLGDPTAFKYIGGSSDEDVQDIFVDSLGNIYLAGVTTSSDFGTTQNAFQTSYKGGNGDAYIVKLDGSFNVLASTYFGTAGKDWIKSIYVNVDNTDPLNPVIDVYVAGVTNYPEFQTQQTTYTAGNSIGAFEIFLGKLDGDLQTVNSFMFIGGSGKDVVNDLEGATCSDGSGNTFFCLYITGFTDSFDFPTTINSYRYLKGGIEMFITRVNGNLSSIVSSSYFGTIYDDFANDIEIDSNGNVYIGGYTTSTYIPVDVQSYQDISKGGYEGIIVAVSGDLNLNSVPVINSFVADPSQGEEPLRVTLKWNITDKDFDTLLCEIDINDDGNFEYRVRDCRFNNTQEHIYNANGNYTVRLRVKDPNGGQAEATLSIVVDPFVNNPPVINSFASSLKEIAVNSMVSFKWDIEDPDGDVLTCFVDFNGDNKFDIRIGNCEITDSVGYTYIKEGTYNVIFKVEDGRGGSANSQVSIKVVKNNPPVIKQFTSSPSEGEAPLSVMFKWEIADKENDRFSCSLDVNGDGRADYTFEDCNDKNSHPHIYEKGGEYKATLIVEDMRGAKSTSGIVIKVKGGAIQQGEGKTAKIGGGGGKKGCASFDYGILSLLIYPFVFILRRRYANRF